MDPMMGFLLRWKKRGEMLLFFSRGGEVTTESIHSNTAATMQINCFLYELHDKRRHVYDGGVKLQAYTCASYSAD